MHKPRFIAALILSVVALAVMPAYAQFPAQGDDNTTSLGSFRVNIATKFQPLFANCPAYNAGTNVLQSPTLFDPQTDIGRSSAITDGSNLDINGVPVGAANTIVGENILIAPPGFGFGANTREVHTEVRSLHMTSGGTAVRAGIWYNSSTGTTNNPAKISPGEVESQSGPNGQPANDFPASSYFDVFAQVDIPACGNFPGGTLYNAMPLIVKNNNVTSFPPRVVYLHDSSSVVPILFLNANPGVWNKDDILGYFLLAGHGIGFSNSSSDTSSFNSFMSSQPDAPCPFVPAAPPAPSPTPTPTGGGGCTVKNGAVVCLPGASQPHKR